MADHRVEPSVGEEERTEPIPPSEMDARVRGLHMHEADFPVGDETVHLDDLQLDEDHRRQNIRLLVRPFTKFHNAHSVTPNGDDNCKWLALRAEVASKDQPEYKVLAVTQTANDIKFSVRIPGESREELRRPPLWCELYYDPASDKVIFLNKSDVPILLEMASHPVHTHGLSDETRIINPGLAKALRPGTWRIRVGDIAVLDFRILEKRPVTIYRPIPQITDVSSSMIGSQRTQGSMKRPRSPDEGDERRYKRRISDTGGDLDDGAVMFLRPGAADSDSLVFPLPNARENRELAVSNGHALLDSVKGETISVAGVCELDEYELTKHEPIASTALSAVYTAAHSEVPDEIITVKVLKTRVTNGGDRPYAHERNVIRQAEMWLHESQSQEDLEHASIVKYYGGDARFLSLYMEHVNAQDLTAIPQWRNKLDDEFQGTRHDALRILRDISEALSYIHSRHMVHNDIKPANILYSSSRGAVLCDFGLSTPASKPPSGGGTPYYIPPEFIGQKLRGPASDVWALGVTLLYVMRKIRFPDSRARRNHPRPLYWQIAGINSPHMPHVQYGNGQSAANQMKAWLQEVFEARERLNKNDYLERIVMNMLIPNPRDRITMAKVVQELSATQS